MRRGHCRRHGDDQPCTCAMGNLYRYVEPLTLYLLKKQKRAYGYELVKGVNEHALTDSIVEAGALYRTLRRLEANGYVISEWDASNMGPARRVYELTEDGIVHLQEWIVIINQLSKSMAEFHKDAEALFESA